MLIQRSLVVEHEKSNKDETTKKIRERYIDSNNALKLFYFKPVEKFNLRYLSGPMEQKKRKRLARLRDKFRFVILNDNTFEELLTLKLSFMNMFVYGFVAIVLTIIATTILISFTALREFIPGHTSSNMRREALELSRKADSLEYALEANNKYIESITRILSGEPIDTVLEQMSSDTSGGMSSFELSAPSPEDSAFRDWVEEETEFALNAQSGELTITQLFPPISGMITSGFEKSTSHFAVDITAPMNTPVKNCADGTVILTDWSSETGHIVAIQHSNNLVSVYKHNSAVLKKIGDFIQAGEAIAIIGNSGENSTGPHLHFELWFNGAPINPEDYIHF